MIDRIRTKILKLEKLNIKPTYLVLSKPPAIELFYWINEKNFNNDTLISFDGFTSGTFFGLKIIVLQTNKEIVEVG